MNTKGRDRTWSRLRQVLLLSPLIGIAVLLVNVREEGRPAPRSSSICSITERDGEVRWSGTVTDLVDNGSSLITTLSNGDCETVIMVPKRYRLLVEVGQRPTITGNVMNGQVNVRDVEAGQFNLEGELTMDYVTVHVHGVPNDLMLGYQGRHRDGYEWWGVLETPGSIRDQLIAGGTYRIYYRDGVVQRVVAL